MSDALISTILQQLTKVVYEEGKQQVKLVTCVGKEIESLKSTLESIHALLEDAEEKQMKKDKSIKIWLERLKQVCYDIEDVLDEWNTVPLKSQLDEADQNIFSLFKGKVCGLFLSCFCCGQVVHRCRFALKIKDINERLDKIAKDKDRYQLIPREVTQPRRVERSGRVESTSFTEVSNLHGRDAVKKDLIYSLLCGNSDVKTISIVGMGGIGKTALAQLVYNDEAVKANFDKKIWVCVTEVFDLSRIAKAIIMGLAEPRPASASALNLDSFTLQGLLEEICKYIQRKKVFLVLDDVWTDESQSWESLNQALKRAARGSRILVTTRKDAVVKTMKSFRVFPLKQLSEDVCWKILSQEAFAGRGREQCKNVEDIGKKIAKKCSGLPLAAKTIGSMLRFRRTREQWKIILNSEIWKLESEGIFAPLLLSYLDLPSAVRQCFSYCSTFPKGVQIERESLIHQWMAQGYLNSSENPEMEIIGDEYFECLVARSFFQDFQKLKDGSIWACKIHDILLDFARFLMGDDDFVLKEVHPEDNFRMELSSEKIHHLLVILTTNACFPTSLLGAEKLRSLSIFRSDREGDVTGNLFIQLKHLRSLIFSGGNINGFPEGDKLMHLKLLDLSDSWLERLPEAICGLWNLQSLFLRRCPYLKALPDKIEKLVNLRHLNTDGCRFLTYYPKGIGRLTSLRELVGIMVCCDHNDDKKFSLGDLENLCHLRCLVLITGCRQIDTNEARRAKLQNKIDLKDLDLVCPWPLTREKDDVIKVLSPASHTNVKFRLRLQATTYTNGL
ncbi:hypothetical protein SLA2020_071040 [Shorea laevis]